MNYLIKTAGRAGSHKVMFYISRNLKSEILDVDKPELYNYNKKITYVAHCHHQDSEHKIFMPNDPENWTMIKVFRKDPFEQALSDVIHLNTRKDINKPFLTAKDIGKVKLDVLFANEKAFYNNLWYFYRQEQLIKSIDTSCFHSCIELDYKEIIDNSFVKKLPFDGNIEKIHSIQNPWDKSQVFLNYNSLRKIYKKFRRKLKNESPVSES